MLAVATCVCAGVAFAANAPVVLRAQSNGTIVHLHVGNTVLVELAANASTGYSWSFSSRGGPELRLLWAKYLSPPQTTGLPRVGALGIYEAKLRADRAGHVSLRLVYARHTHPATPVRRFAVTLVVAP